MSLGPVAVVLAAGTGSRVGGQRPKQFLEVSGTSVLARTLASFTKLDRIIVVYHPLYLEDTRGIIESIEGRCELVEGGSTRRDSIASALNALSALPDDVPLILQNAASPNTPPEVLRQCIDALHDYDITQAYVPAVDTIFEYRGKKIVNILPRERLGYTADPTVYRLGVLRRIIEAQQLDREAGEMTLDTALKLGYTVHLVLSPRSNIKITTPGDIASLAAFLNESDNY
jgi:2-C-methyl-D-erythritol 4-phosphate cytidylyltransferase